MKKKNLSLPIHLYIAEESAIIRQRLVEAISEINGIELVGQGGRAVEIALAVINLRPDVVILDIHMPGGGSFDVLREIKRPRATRPLVICTTTSDISQYRWKYQASGANYFFNKNTDFEQILQTLRSLTTSAPPTPVG